MTTDVITVKSLGRFNISRPATAKFYMNMLIYGNPGVGKTRLAASASQVEELGPVLLLDMEGGTLSLRNVHNDVDIVRVTSFREFGEIFGELKGGAIKDYNTIILDSLTEIQKFGMYDIMKRAVEVAADKDEYRDPDLPGIGEWGKNIEQTRKLVRAFRDLPCNTIFTALAMDERSRKDRIKAKPQLSGKLSNEVAGFLDIVLFMYLKEDEDENTRRLILSQGTEDIVAKDRTDSLPTLMVDPTMQEIYNTITTV